MQEGFAPFYNSDNRQLLPIRQLNLAKNKMQIQSNQDLSEAEKARRVEKIDAQLKELQQYAKMVKKF
jgi:phosphonate transport system substrate-binding protein